MARWCVLFLVGACYRGTVDDSCNIQCTSTCPSGLSCVAGRCTSGAICGSTPDAAADTAADAAPAAAFVQHGDIGGIVADASLPFALAQRAGDLNVAVVEFSSPATIVSVADTKGNTYVVAADVLASGAGAQAIYYARNIAAADAGANTITVTFSAQTTMLFRALEYSGVSATSIAHSSAMGDGTSVDSGHVTVAAVPALLVAADQLVYESAAIDPAYTLRSDYYGNIVEDRVVTEAGAYNATDTQNVSGGWVMELVAFSLE